MEHEHATSLTARAVKKSLPDRALLTKDARKTINTATSMFTLYLASIAHETSVAHKRSTITLNDVLQALRDTDFDHFIHPIEASLQEAKVLATRKKNQKAMEEEKNEQEETSDVADQLDDVTIDTNEEDADENEDMLSTDERLDADGKDINIDENTEVHNSADDAMQDENANAT